MKPSKAKPKHGSLVRARCSPKLIADLKSCAKAHRRTASDMLRVIMQDYFDAHTNGKKNAA